jgi:hypothetical protein
MKKKMCGETDKCVTGTTQKKSEKKKEGEEISVLENNKKIRWQNKDGRFSLVFT